MKILIVDDVLHNRFVLQKMMEPMGLVHAVATGEEALEAVDMSLAQGEPYDLILLDILMPDMDGQQVLKAIRTQEEARAVFNQSKIKIVMVTALSDPQSVMTAFKEQCDGYLVKPVMQEHLQKLLSDLRLIGEA